MSLENKMNEWVNCFGMSGLGKAPIDCYTSGYGEVVSFVLVNHSMII
jgi:interferon gamma-inducible protein 30